MYHEVPYALAVFVDKFEEKPKLLRIEATLNVERDSQKKILIGHKGDMLKKIGTEARKELEALLRHKIFLETFVKVVPDWREDPQQGARTGLAFPAGRSEPDQENETTPSSPEE